MLSSTPTSPGGGLLGLENEDPYWFSWQRRAPKLRTFPAPLEPEEVILFDAWSIEDSRARNQFFNGLFVLLQSLPSQLPPEGDREGLEVVTILLSESILDTAQAELAFFSTSTSLNPWKPESTSVMEGVVLSLVDPRGTGLIMKAFREIDGPRTPQGWVLRVEPGFEDRPGLTLFWDLSSGAPQAYWSESPDASLSDLKALSSEAALQAQPFLAYLEETLWKSCTGDASLSPPFSIAAQKEEELAPGWPATLGRSLQPRGLETLGQESVFLPRQPRDPLESIPF